MYQRPKCLCLTHIRTFGKAGVLFDGAFSLSLRKVWGNHFLKISQRGWIKLSPKMLESVTEKVSIGGEFIWF